MPHGLPGVHWKHDRRCCCFLGVHTEQACSRAVESPGRQLLSNVRHHACSVCPACRTLLSATSCLSTKTSTNLPPSQQCPRRPRGRCRSSSPRASAAPWALCHLELPRHAGPPAALLPPSSQDLNALLEGTQPPKGLESWLLLLAFRCICSRPVLTGLLQSGEARTFSWRSSVHKADCFPSRAPQ